MKTELKLLFLILLALCVRLSFAADLPPEYNVMVEYRSLYSQLGSSEDANEASMVKRRRLHRLERELKAAGLTEEEFEQLRKGKNRAPSKADKIAMAKVTAAIETYEESGSGLTYRSNFVENILAMGHVPGLENLAALIPKIAANDDERFELEEKILIFLEGKNHPWSPVVRRQIISQTPIFTRHHKTRSFFLTPYILDPIYSLGLNAKEENDFPAMNAVLNTIIGQFTDIREISALIDGLEKNPEYISKTLIETLYNRNSLFADHGYMFELMRLMRFLPADVRRMFVIEGLHYLNRFTVSSLYFNHPVFNEDHFLKVLSEELNQHHSAGYLSRMNETIFTRPEFAKRPDLAELAPHIVLAAPCEELLDEDADEN